MKMRILTAILFSSVIFLFGPLVTYVHNHRSLSIPFQYVFLYGILLFAAGTLVMFLLLCLFRGKLLSIICALIMGISFYLWFNGSFVDWNLGVLDGSQINWSGLITQGRIELALLALFLVCAMFFHRKIMAKASKICAFLLLVQFLNISYLLITTPSARIIGDTRIPHSAAVAAHSFSFSAQQNAIVIVLDSFENYVFDAIAAMANGIDIDHIFRDFTYFRNTTAGFPTTMPTIPMLLHGRMYSNEDGPFSAFQNRVMNENSLPLLLQNNGFDIVMSEIASRFGHFEPILQKDYITTMKYWWDIFRADVFFISLIRKAPLLGKKILLEEAFFMDALHRWMYNDIKYFYNFINTANNNNPSPTFRFHHLWGIHPPYSLTRDVTLRRGNYSSNAMLEQGIGYLKIVEKFLEKLRTIGVYDNSIIVICADHGKGGHHMSLPLLLIKPINATGEKMSVSLAPAALSDIPKTIAENLRLPNDLPGVDVFSLEESDQRVRYFYYYTWNQAYWQKDMLPPITKIRIPPLSIERERVINFSLSDFNAPLYFNIKNSSQLRVITLLGEFHAPETNHQWTGGNSHIGINQDTPIDPNETALIHIRGRNLTQERPTKIFWNDEIIGVVSSAQWEESTFIISATSIEPRNTLRFYTPDVLSPRSLNIGEDPRTLGFALGRISINFAEFPTAVKFGTYGNDSNYIVSGFSGPESGFRWTDGNRAVLQFWPHEVADNLTARFDLFPLLREGVLSAQRVDVFVNENKVADWELTGPAVKEIALPRFLVGNQQFEMTFLLPDAISPKDLGINDDPRKLAIAFRAIQFFDK